MYPCKALPATFKSPGLRLFNGPLRFILMLNIFVSFSNKANETTTIPPVDKTDEEAVAQEEEVATGEAPPTADEAPPTEEAPTAEDTVEQSAETTEESPKTGL